MTSNQEIAEIRVLVTDFVSACNTRFNDRYSYATGFLSAKVVELASKLPKTQRAIFKGELAREIDHVEKLREWVE